MVLPEEILGQEDMVSLWRIVNLALSKSHQKDLG